MGKLGLVFLIGIIIAGITASFYKDAECKKKSIEIDNFLKEQKVKKIGHFSSFDSKTDVFQAGECKVFSTIWGNEKTPRFFFSCDNKK